MGVPGIDTEQNIVDWIEQYRVTEFVHVLDPAGDVWSDFGVHSQPSMVFIAADGTWERHVGALGPIELETRVESLL